MTEPALHRALDAFRRKRDAQPFELAERCHATRSDLFFVDRPRNDPSYAGSEHLDKTLAAEDAGELLRLEVVQRRAALRLA